MKLPKSTLLGLAALALLVDTGCLPRIYIFMPPMAGAGAGAMGALGPGVPGSAAGPTVPSTSTPGLPVGPQVAAAPTAPAGSLPAPSVPAGWAPAPITTASERPTTADRPLPRGDAGTQPTGRRLGETELLLGWASDQLQRGGLSAHGAVASLEASVGTRAARIAAEWLLHQGQPFQREGAVELGTVQDAEARALMGKAMRLANAQLLRTSTREAIAYQRAVREEAGVVRAAT